MTLPGYTAGLLLSEKIEGLTDSMKYHKSDNIRVMHQELHVTPSGRCPRHCSLCECQFNGEEWGCFKRCVLEDCDEYYRRCTPPPRPCYYSCSVPVPGFNCNTRDFCWRCVALGGSCCREIDCCYGECIIA